MKLLMMPSLVWNWSCRSNQPVHRGTVAPPADSGLPSILLEAYKDLPNVLCCGHNQFSSMSWSITPVIVVSTKTNGPYTVFDDSTQNTFSSGSLLSARLKSLGYVRSKFDSCAYLPS